MKIFISITPEEPEFKIQNKKFWDAEERFCKEYNWRYKIVSACSKLAEEIAYETKNGDGNSLLSVRVEKDTETSVLRDILLLKDVMCFVIAGDNVICKVNDLLCNGLKLTTPFVTTCSVYNEIISDHHFHCWSPLLLDDAQLAAYDFIAKNHKDGEYFTVVYNKESEYGLAVLKRIKDVFSVAGMKSRLRYMPFSRVLRSKCPLEIKDGDVYISGFDDQYHNVVNRISRLRKRKSFLRTNAAVKDKEHNVKFTCYDCDQVKDKFSFFMFQTLCLVEQALNWKSKGYCRSIEDGLEHIKYRSTPAGVFLMSDMGQLIVPLQKHSSLKPIKQLQNQVRTQEDIAHVLQIIDEIVPSAKMIAKGILNNDCSAGDLLSPFKEELSNLFEGVLTRFLFRDIPLFVDGGAAVAVNDCIVVRDYFSDVLHYGSIQIELRANPTYETDLIRIFVKIKQAEDVVPISYIFENPVFDVKMIESLVLAKTQMAASLLLREENEPSKCLSFSGRMVKLKECGSRVIRMENKREINKCGQVIEVLQRMRRASDCLYVVPEQISYGLERDKEGVLFFSTKTFLSYFDLKILANSITRITEAIKNELHLKKIAEANTKSAIGSIMSRNGSHNIGSHVLAALSHNVGTMPDDRVLYQYIQHRMDYIATVTTESPSWAASTKFVGEMMRTFMSQRHLLEYIASSEGLHAYRFQDPNIDPKNQKQTIQIHVRYGKKDAVSDGSKVRFRELFDFKGLENPLDPVNDVMLAIPGGVVGQHAFFTIIENVIRNAAKHGWSSRTERERTNANLEIYIDAVDDISKKDVTFRIWDNMSQVRVDQDLSGLRKKIGVPVAKKYLSSEQVSKLLDRYAEETESGFKGERLLDGDKIPLHWRQQILMDQRIIQANGSLRRENWGMAEMKISAGYLQRRTIGQIGGLDALTEKDDFIVRAIAVPEDKVYHLGYEFNIPRPKRILILLKDETLPSNEAELNRQGIYFLRNSEARTAIADWDNGEKTDKFAAEYLVIQSPKALFKSSDIITRFADVPFPFRVLTCEDLSFAQKENQDECLNKGKKRICAMVHKIGDVKWSENNTWDVDKISSDVLKAWREHCLSRRGMETDMMPHVNTRGESGSGQALISNRDIWQVLFTEHFHSTLDSFQKSEQVEKDLDAFCQWLLGHRSEYEFTAFENVEIDDLDKPQVVARQFKHLLSKISDPQFVKVRLDEVLKSQIADVQRGPEMLRAIYDKYRKDPRPDVGRLIMHFKHAFEQLDVMLRKYEERIVTLPNSYSLSKGALENQPSFDKTSGLTDTSESSGISYNRHHKVTDADYEKTYTEPLSGSQSYLNDLVVYQRHYISCQGNFDKLGSEDRFLNVRLVENGLMRILFVDERVSRFLRGHEKSRQYYRAMNMWCVDETSLESNGKEEAKETVAADPLSANGKLLTFVRAKDKADVFQMLLGAIKKWQGQGEKDFKFDMIVIHQGVLDKWCKGDYNAGSADGMSKIIEELKKLIDYVVITTGRGTPANIPSCARILPFSTIEGTLFKLYPEKLTFVNSIMNILPLGGKRNG